MEHVLYAVCIVSQQCGAFFALGEHHVLVEQILEHLSTACCLDIRIGELELDYGTGLQFPVALLGEDVVEALSIDVCSGVSHLAA